MAGRPSPQAYVTAGDTGAAETYAAAQATAAHVGVSYRDRDTRGEMTPFRPGVGFVENILRDREIMNACIHAYEEHGLVRNVIDLMSDFATKGVKVVHPRARVEKFGQEWAAKVNIQDRSERLANMVLKAGNAPVKRLTAKLPDKTLDVLRQAKAAAADNAGSMGKRGPETSVKVPKSQQIPDGEIPFGYTILDPRWVEVIGAELAAFAGQRTFQYAVRIPPELYRRLKAPKTQAEKNIIAALPLSILQGAISDGRLVPLPPNKTVCLHYKKDDYRVWAQPMLYPILEDLVLYKKLKRADAAALDGVISKVRLWQLGSLDHRIFPTPAAIQRLSDVLSTNVGGGSMDLIWGPELNLIESKADAAVFLGSEKYQPTLMAIYQGLGIPMTLAGASDGGFTNNALGLRVLLDRLEYIRGIIIRFWMTELELLRAALGFREPFELQFDMASLSDEAAMTKLLIDLFDRDVVSLEYVQDRIGALPGIEASRLRREMKARDEGRLPKRAGPFYLDSTQKATNERAFVQQGTVTPSQVGIDHPKPQPGEKTLVQQQNQQKLAQMAQKASVLASTKKPKKRNGRPTGGKDVGKRKKKKVLPRTAAAMAWACEAQAGIEQALRPAFLKARKRANLRQLTTAEFHEFEQFKFATLCQFDVGTEVTAAAVAAALRRGTVSVPDEVEDLYRATVAREADEPTAEKARQIQAAVYALYRTAAAETEKDETDGDDCGDV